MTAEGEQGCPETDPETMVQEQIVYPGGAGNTGKEWENATGKGRQTVTDASYASCLWGG